MSLFRTKEWWRTQCGTNEVFDGKCLLAAPLFGANGKDVLLVTSHSGYVRIYDPSSQWLDEEKAPSEYKSTDLMIEMKIDECIVDTKTGRFLSGSQDLRLAILTPTKLRIYNVVLTKGPTEQGDHCDLEIAYEHELPRFPFSLTVGPFGGVRGRDFLCVQCLDGTLLFYEQESFSFSQVLRNRLLPEPIVYVSRNDVFVTASSSWCLECYRYQSIAEFGRNKEAGLNEGKNLEPDWTYNVGEAILDIDAVTLSSFEVGIVVLGERNLYCLKNNCAALKYAKRFDYKPVCFRPYVIEPDGKLMVLVIADTSTLMIYEGTTLKWSAQLPFLPVAVTRANLQHLDGALIILSEEGRLEACYLGSEPSLFIAPPLHRRSFDYAEAEKELAEIRKRSKKLKASDQATEVTDNELIISVNVSPDLEACPFVPKTESKDESYETRHYMCNVSIELSSYTPLKNVQVFVDAYKPLALTKSHAFIGNLCDRQILRTTVYVNRELPAITAEVKITTTYETDRGSLRVLQRTAQLPLKMLLRGCPPENTSVFTVTIKCNEALVGFNQLFPEFTSDHLQRQNWNALGLQHVHTGNVVSIVSGNASNRYRVQSNDGLSVTLVVQQLVNRLKDKSMGSMKTSISQNHMQLVYSQIDAHFAARQEIDRITTEIGLLMVQLRNIERRMLRAVRERNGKSLPSAGLPFLLETTCRSIFALLNNLAAARAERERAGHGLQCSLRLLLLLLRLNVNDDNNYALLEAAIGFEPQLRDDVDWEEIADVALSGLLKSTSKKPTSMEPRASAWSKFSAAKDVAKLKKRLGHVVERLHGNRESDIAENEPENVTSV